MAYDLLERSSYEGAPVALYEIQIGSLRWRYASSPGLIQDATGNWEPLAISDNGVSLAGNREEDEVTVTAPSDLPIVAIFRSYPPSEAAALRLFQRHQTDPDVQAIWQGTIASVKDSGARTVEIIGRSLASTFRRAGLRLAWSRNCPYSLYDQNCKVNPASHITTSVITGVGPASIAGTNIGLLGTGHFSGGYIEWSRADTGGTIERRGIESHTGGEVALYGGTRGLAVGMTINLFPGCNRTRSRCSHFNNVSNFGGFDLPEKSPFDGDPVY